MARDKKQRRRFAVKCTIFRSTGEVETLRVEFETTAHNGHRKLMNAATWHLASSGKLKLSEGDHFIFDGVEDLTPVPKKLDF